MKPDGDRETVICSLPWLIETAGNKRDEMMKGDDSFMGFDLICLI
jgi:hypothetical protein